MDTDMKLPAYQPSHLSYYTTWWLASMASTSSQTTMLSNLDNDNDDSVDVKEGKKQKGKRKHNKLICCIPIKIFR